MPEGIRQISQDNLAENKEPKSTILQKYEKWKGVPPLFIDKKPLSIEDVAKQEGCELSFLESDIRNKVSIFAKDMEKECSFPSEEYMDLIDSLYNLFLLSQKPEVVASNPWVSSFSSFNSFAKNFCPNASPHGASFIKKNVQCFIESVINEEKIFKISPNFYYGVNQEGIREVYNHIDEWVLLPDEYYDRGRFEYTSKEVVQEIVNLIKEDYRPAKFSHASGSAALVGIEKSGAILSAQEVIKEGGTIATGEHVSYVSSHTGHPVAGGKHGLGSIYASKHGPTYGYYHLNWFDEYFVSFGINGKKQEDYLASVDFKYDMFSSADNPTRIADMGSEGVIIGDRVPLNNVDFVYTWKKYEEETKEWIKKNCPKAKFVSIEAQTLLVERDYKFKEIADKENISVQEVWERILS